MKDEESLALPTIVMKDEEVLNPPARPSVFKRLNTFKSHKGCPISLERQICPEHTAGFFSLLTFTWMSSIMALGYRRPLERNDIWLINPSRSTHKLAANLKRAFQDHHAKGNKNPLMRALFQTFKFEILLGGAAAFLGNMVQVMAPFVVKYIIYYANDVWYARKLGIPTPPLGRGIGLVICLTCMQICGSIGQNHFFYRGMMVGGQARSSLISIIFDKSMTISGRAKAGGKILQPPPTGTSPGSEEEKKHFETQVVDVKDKKSTMKKKKNGKPETDYVEAWSNSRIVNLMSVDTYRIDQACGWMHMVWGNPFSMIFIILLLCINLGYSALPGIALFFLSTPLVAYGTRAMFKRRKDINKLTDQRVRIIQEVLQAIKFVKYYAWEADFMKRLGYVRQLEIGGIRLLLGIRQVINAFGAAMPVFASMLSFITFSLSGHPLNPGQVFSSLALFNQMRMPLIMLPMILGTVSDAWQSVHRIEQFLLAENTTDTTTVLEDGTFAVNLQDSSFTWEKSERPDPNERLPMTDVGGRGPGGPGGPRGKGIPGGPGGPEGPGREGRGGKGPAGKQPGGRSEPDNEELQHAPDTPPFIIDGLNLRVKSSELVAVVGEVGSGKSSLLSAIAGEMRRISGTSAVVGNRAFCPQVAWIQNATVRDNITFGKQFEQSKYDQVIEACGLSQDLQILPRGSSTEIGERGINLSGGQKQRVSLARAMYFDSDIILLDDPLAAVDAHVGAHIMDEAICGVLKNKCRVLATHQLQVLPRCDRIIIMENGRIAAYDTFANLMEGNKTFQAMMKAIDIVEQKKLDEEFSDGEDEPLKREESINLSQEALMQEEDRPNAGGVPWEVFKDYFKSSGGYLVPILVLLSVILAQGTNILTNLWLAWWSDNHFNMSTGRYIGVYVAFGLAQAILLYFSGLAITISGTEASKRMFQRATLRILRAPLSFFDTTPLGRITNRFSKDIDVMDNFLTESMRLASITLSMVLGIVILTISYYYYFAIALVPICIIYFSSAMYYRASARELKRHEAVLRSSVFARFSEAISGTSTLRAYGVEKEFSIKLTDAIDEMDSAYYLTFANQRWLCVRLDAIGAIFIFVTGMLVVTDKFSVTPSISGLVLSYLIAITQLLQFSVRQSAEVHNNMNAVERLHTYGYKIPQEADEDTKSFKLSEQWPQYGEVTFTDVQMRYRPGLPLVLHGLNLHIQPGERLGIVGRTGAGKSSIMALLFRIVEVSSGSIIIDGLDISKVGLNNLRSRMSIIPQDPTLFRGTVRSNLDPFNERTDLELWSALRHACLIDDEDVAKQSENRITLSTVVENEGTNFSLGQRQLMAIARALIRNSRIVVCDEATSSIDFESDRKIQQAMVKGFKGRSLLCIAHRLKTVIGYDRVCVIEEGRVVELGAPKVLFVDGGRFRQMCDESQIGEEEIECAQIAAREETSQ